MFTKLFIDKHETWEVRIVERSDRYGLNDCLEHKGIEPMVEFWDCHRDKHESPHQFVSRYCLSTMRDRDSLTQPHQALDLMGYEPKWTVSADCMVEVLEWLSELVWEKAETVSSPFSKDQLVANIVNRV